MKITDHTLSLIIARLNGTASRQQEEELRQWMEASDGNREEYETYARIWKESGAQLGRPSFDANAAWQKVAPQLSPDARNDHGRTGTGKRLSFYIKRVAIAASLIVMAAAGYYYWTSSSSTHAIADDTNKSVVLPDGSVVTLRKGSSLTYSRRFNQAERTVQLEGEAFFQVKHNGEKPFLVLTRQVQVRVTGTSFLVRSGKAVEEVMVASGRVTVTNRNMKKGIQLVAGQKAVLHSNLLEQLQLTDSNYIAWKTGVLNFNNTPLAKVLDDLQQYYAVPLKAGGDDSAAIRQTMITVRFQNQPLVEVLDELRLITGLEVRREGDGLVLYKK